VQASCWEEKPRPAHRLGPTPGPFSDSLRADRDPKRQGHKVRDSENPPRHDTAFAFLQSRIAEGGEQEPLRNSACWNGKEVITGVKSARR